MTSSMNNLLKEMPNKITSKSNIEKFLKFTNHLKPEFYRKNISNIYEKNIYKKIYHEELSKPKIPYDMEKAYFLYACTLLEENKYKEATYNLKMTLKWNPVHRKAILILCKINFNNQNYQEAFELAIKGLEIEFIGKYILYYYSVITFYYLKRKNFVLADEYASALLLLDKDNVFTHSYLKRRNIKEIVPTALINENIIDSLLETIETERNEYYITSLLSYEIMPIFNRNSFYFIINSDNFSVFVQGSYVLITYQNKRYLDIKDNNSILKKVALKYLNKTHFKSYSDKEDIKIKYNDKFCIIDKNDIIYNEVKEDIINCVKILIENKKTLDELLEN